MFKNVASQKIILIAYDSTSGQPKTGDAANITAYVSKDGGAVTVLGDTSATEMDATNAKGAYIFDLTQGETNADMLLFSAKSATANIYVDPVLAFTVGDLTATAKASVNAEVVDALSIDTYAQPTQGAPPATTSMKDMMAYVYKAFRNRKDQTAAQFSLYNDDAVTIDHKSATSDNGTTFTAGEMASGP